MMEDVSVQEFESYYEKHYLQVFRYIMKKIGNMQDAEDLAMESFMSCYKNFDKFDSSKASFATWLYVIVNNRIKNYYRDHKIDCEIDETISISDNFEDSVIKAQYLSEMRNVLADALDKISDTQRQIVIKKYYQDMSSQQIADELGLTAVNVRVQLTRALDKIKKIIGNKESEI